MTTKTRFHSSTFYVAQNNFETCASSSLTILVTNDEFNILIKSNQILLDITYRNGGFRFL